jgi:hypothetical protein
MSLFFIFKKKDNLALLKKIFFKTAKNNSAQRQSFDSSDIYSCLTDLQTEYKTIMMPPQPKNTIVIYRAEDMAVT